VRERPLEAFSAKLRDETDLDDQIGYAVIGLAGADEQEQIANDARDRARSLVFELRSQIKDVAETLAERKTLDERGCREVLEKLIEGG
jgi:hypothetical protein